MNNNRYFEDNDEFLIDFGIRDVLNSIRKLWCLGILLIAVCAMLYAWWTKRKYTPEYQTTASFAVEINYAGEMETAFENTDTEENSSADNSGTGEYNFYHDQEVASMAGKTFYYLVNGSRMQGLLKEELGTDYVNGSISASAIEGTNVFTLSVVSSQAQDAYNIIQAVISHYQEIAQHVFGDFSMTMIEEPVFPENSCNHFSVKKKIITGGIVGLGIWCLLVFLYLIFRRNIRLENDISEKLGQISLGVMSNDGTASHVINNMKENQDKVLLVTSTSPGEGKTAVTVNLAKALNRLHYRVLMVDADLYKQDLKHWIEETQKDSLGLTDYFTEELSVEDVISHSDKLNCDIISGRCITGDVSSEEMLSSDKTGNLIKMLSEQYDYILIDTPACGKLIDAVELARYADSALFVIKRDYAKVPCIKKAVKNLQFVGIHLTGCILNDIF